MRASALAMVFAVGIGTTVASCGHGVNVKSVEACRSGRPRYFTQDGLDDRFGQALCVMGENPLASPPADEAYRFLWLRSFHDPVAVRVEVSHGEALLTAVELDGPIDHGRGTLARSDRRKLAASEWAALVRAVEAAGFWGLPLEGGNIGLDGASWILEGKRGGSQHVVVRWSPEGNAFRAACDAFLAASRFPFPKDEVY
ncbi:MAG TPA: hypothetical protein VIF57_14490 [Polyangia bacterium]